MSGRSRGDDSRYGDSRYSDSCVPKINAIFQGEVAAIKEYGAFIKIPGCYKNGLVHKTQLARCRVDNVMDIVNIRDKVWCKVISVGDDGSKIALSMKVVHQGTGRDLDPNGLQIGLDERRRRSYAPSESRITLEAVFNTTCRRCGTRGHLAQDCFQVPGARAYELLSDDDQIESTRYLQNDYIDKRLKEPKPKKAKKRRKHEQSSHSDESSSVASDSDTSGSDKRKSRPHHHHHHHHKKRKVPKEFPYSAPSPSRGSSSSTWKPHK